MLGAAAAAVLVAALVLTGRLDDPESSWFGHSVLLHWWQRDTLVVVSVIGHSDVNRRLVVALANHLRFTSPRR